MIYGEYAVCPTFHVICADGEVSCANVVLNGNAGKFCTLHTASNSDRGRCSLTEIGDNYTVVRSHDRRRDISRSDSHIFRRFGIENVNPYPASVNIPPNGHRCNAFTIVDGVNTVFDVRRDIYHINGKALCQGLIGDRYCITNGSCDETCSPHRSRSGTLIKGDNGFLTTHDMCVNCQVTGRGKIVRANAFVIACNHARSCDSRKSSAGVQAVNAIGAAAHIGRIDGEVGCPAIVLNIYASQICANYISRDSD